MPYCPKCDMEFVEGITVCSDCSGLLAESEEAAKAMQLEEKARQEAEFMASFQKDNSFDDDLSETLDDQAEHLQKSAPTYVANRVYVKKSQKYEDLKASASAFLIIGIVLLVFSSLCLLNVIKLPMSGFSKTMSEALLAIMGVGAVITAFLTSRSAKSMTSQVDEENKATKTLTDWFITSYSGEALDHQLKAEDEDLSSEELSLKRFELIQDILVTHHDITDQSYVDVLAEDIYSKLYESYL